MIIGLVSWWYTTGWVALIRKMGARIASVLGFFSVGQLAGSLFAPFRQISAGTVQGSLKVKFQAWVDQTFSRLIGAVVRLLLIFAGLVIAMLIAIVAVIVIVVWPIVPILPLIGFVLSMGIMQ